MIRFPSSGFSDREIPSISAQLQGSDVRRNLSLIGRGGTMPPEKLRRSNSTYIPYRPVVVNLVGGTETHQFHMRIH